MFSKKSDKARVSPCCGSEDDSPPSNVAAPAYTGERATGYGVALLNVLFGDSSGAALLRSAAPKCHSDNGGSDHE